MARGPAVFTIPPGVPFLDTAVDALLRGAVVPDFSRASGPLGLSEATIFVPSRRAARALGSTIAAHLGPGATFLPRIVPLGALDALEPGLALTSPLWASAASPAIRPPIGEVARRMILMRLILGWGASVRNAILTVGPDGQRDTHETETLLVATTPADAWHLSGELAGLIDELESDGVGWDKLGALGTETFDRYWAITLDFLQIAMGQWPLILETQGLVDPATHYAAVVDAEIARLQARGDRSGPVIVAGVASADRATARLVAAVSRLPSGAVILPGLDQGLDDAAWAAITPLDPTPGSAAGHPQAGLRRIVEAIGIDRSDVAVLGEPSAALRGRSALVSEALRPAETTDSWRELLGDGRGGLDPERALAGVTLIEATDEREEALALAVVLRETLEGEGTAILVTPDRDLARRVREDMARWGIEIDDSGGEPLAKTAAGALSRLALEAIGGDLDPLAILALLTHPTVRLGRNRLTLDVLVRRAEAAVLRGVLPPAALRDPAALVAAARERAAVAREAGSRRAPADFDALERLLVDCFEALDPLLDLAAAPMLPSLGDWLRAHETAVAALTRTEEGGSALGGPDGASLARLFDEMIAEGDPAIVLGLDDYRALFERFVGEAVVRGPERSHPRLKILGLLEARLLSADRILLAGLDEAIWPPQVRGDAFLNRPMRTALGLAAPERRISQSAHDFTMALGQPEVVISRARKRGGSPTVPSRFLQRLAAVAGSSWERCRERGGTYLGWARALERPERPVVLPRPAPKPPLELRPDRLSVTRVEVLRRDPYSIYAERILRLRPLDEIGAAAGPREYGTLFHGALSAFLQGARGETLPADARLTLEALVRDGFAPWSTTATFRTFSEPRLANWIAAFLGWEGERRADLAAHHAEEVGRLDLTLADGSTFALTATADRIDRSRAGGLHVVDYKTGRAPSPKEIAAGFAPQLTLEAAMLERGAFPTLGPGQRVESASYVKFGTGREVEVTGTASKTRSLPDLVTDHMQGLIELLDEFRDPATGYVSRPFPQFVSQHGDYDHLARVKEWSVTGRGGEGEE